MRMVWMSVVWQTLVNRAMYWRYPTQDTWKSQDSKYVKVSYFLVVFRTISRQIFILHFSGLWLPTCHPDMATRTQHYNVDPTWRCGPNMRRRPNTVTYTQHDDVGPTWQRWLNMVTRPNMTMWSQHGDVGPTWRLGANMAKCGQHGDVNKT